MSRWQVCDRLPFHTVLPGFTGIFSGSFVIIGRHSKVADVGLAKLQQEQVFAMVGDVSSPAGCVSSDSAAVPKINFRVSIGNAVTHQARQ